MSEGRFERFWRDAARSYHRPPETPQEEMWSRIAAARKERRSRPGTWGVRVRWMRWGVAAAAVLAVGVAIGRHTAPGELDPPSLASDTPAGEAAMAYRVAALDHMQQVETFLTVFRAEAAAYPMESAAGTARELLVGTRLLLGSPAAQNAQLAALLEDIELVLSQIALYSGSDGHEELDLIDQGIERRGVLIRLRAIAPAAINVAAARGEL
jgi:hypothetical protein